MDRWNAAIAGALYSPLPERPSFRTLQLQPGQPSDPIVCQLVPILLEQAEKTYVASSYTWGSTDNPQSITCNGSSMLIQRNAFDMLTDLRLPDRPLSLWIDAICTNQGDLAERARQVSIMRDIYANAEKVTIWLGRPDEHSRAAMAFAAGLDAPKYIRELVAAEYTTSLTDYSKKTYFFEPGPRSEEEKSVAVSIVAFLNRPWFTRIWVQQEASLCRNTKVICGPDVVDWDQIFALSWLVMPPWATLWPDYLPASYSESQPSLIAIKVIQSYKLAAFAPYNTGHVLAVPALATLLLSTSAYDSTDPRDKIYALVGFCDKNGRDWAPEPDYSVPWEVLFTDVWLRALKNGWTNFLSLAGIAHHPPDWVLPSWVPDYRRWNASTVESRTEVDERDEWRAGGPSPAISALQLPYGRLAAKSEELPRRQRRRVERRHMSDELKEYSHSSKQLLNTFISLRCLMMDEIEYTGGSVLQFTGMNKGSQFFASKCKEFIRDDLGVIADRGRELYFNGESVADAYKLTLISCGDHSGRLVGPEYIHSTWDRFMDSLDDAAYDVHGTSADSPEYGRALLSSGVQTRFRFAITKHGYFCLVPETARPTDHVAVIKGCPAPFILRPWAAATATDATEYFELVGNTYVHGMMENTAGCILDYLDCKAKPTPAQWTKVMAVAQENDGQVWKTLGVGNYTEALATLGERWLHLV